ncbi:MAG: polysaccharide biosynthesis protein [Leptolyngbya sp. DLM2.Bin15]|nr:MAG: polysaccharide biosynthesis protein [Leptolyngbya sp. DLM2.Bin15]
MASLKSLALKGAIWTFIAYGFSQGIRLASNLILTRLLIPEYFGLMALVYTFIGGLTLFSDIGIGPSVIQNRRGNEPDFLNTAWTAQIIRGVGLWLCCLLIAWPVAALYEEPRLIWLIPVIGFTMVLGGLESMSHYTLSRDVAMGKLALFEISTQLIGTAVTVIWAWFNATVWALAGGALVAWSLRLIISHTLLPQVTPSRLKWDQDAIKEIISFGKWIFLSTAMMFLSTQSDRLLLGKFLSLEFLGIYSIAFTLGDLPRQINQKVYTKVLFPVMSKISDTPRPELRKKIMKSRQAALAGLMLVVVILAGGGDIIINFLYNENFRSAGWILSIVALGLWPNLMADTLNPCLFAVGQPRYNAYGNFFSFLVIVVGIPGSIMILPAAMGPLGAVLAVALSELPFYIAIALGLYREKLSCLRQDAIFTGLLVILLGGVLVARTVLGLGLPWDGVFA